MVDFSVPILLKVEGLFFWVKGFPSLLFDFRAQLLRQIGQLPAVSSCYFSHAAYAIVAAFVFATLVFGSPAWSAQPTSSAEGNIRLPSSGATPRFSFVTRDVQLSMKKIGYYQGPTDGIFRRDLEHAVRRYQSENDLRVDGLPTPKLMSHINSVGLSNQIIDQLEEAKHANMTRARLALLSQPETRDLIADSEKARRTNPARDKSICFREPSVACLIAEALESARSVSRDTYRDWAIREIIGAQAHAGFDDDVRVSLSALTDPRLILVSMREVAETMAEFGRFEDARRLATTIPDKFNRAKALAAVAVSEASAGREDQATRTVEEVLDLVEGQAELLDAVSVASSLASRLATAGADVAAMVALSGAEKFARSSSNRETREAGLSRIATSLAEMGESDAALILLEEIDRDENKNSVLLATASTTARAGNRNVTLISADGIQAIRYRVLALSKVAEAQSGRGEIKLAAETLAQAHRAIESIESPFALAFALSKIAETESRTGDNEAARKTAASIENKSVRAQTLWRIVEILAARGSVAEVVRTTELAVAATGEIESDFARVWTMSDVAIARVANGRRSEAADAFIQALEASEGLRNNWWRARALSRLAMALRDLEQEN